MLWLSNKFLLQMRENTGEHLIMDRRQVRTVVKCMSTTPCKQRPHNLRREAPTLNNLFVRNASSGEPRT